LVAEPWVPVMIRGRHAEVSLERALLSAHEIDGLALADPLEAVAVLRQVLLPVAVDALGLPRSLAEWRQRWQSGTLDQDRIAHYLETYADRLDLFDSVKPFAQVGGLVSVSGGKKPVSVLLPAVAAGNNVPLFSSRTEADPPELGPAEAVRAVLTAHCWDTAGLKGGAVGDSAVHGGKTAGNPTGPVGQLGVLIPLGRTLAETIMLNTPVSPQGLVPQDLPQWRRPPSTAAWQRRPALGLLDLLTWQARRIRVFPSTAPDGRTVVREALVTAGDRLDFVPEEEPHTAWRIEERPATGRLPRRPLRHPPGRAAWEGMASLLAVELSTRERHVVQTSSLLRQVADLEAEAVLETSFPLRVLVTGVEYGQQAAVIEDVVSDELPLPVAALCRGEAARDVVLAAVDEAEQLRRAADRLASDLRRAAGAEPSPWDHGDYVGGVLIHELTPLARRLLIAIQRAPGEAEAAREVWHGECREVALAVAEPLLNALSRSAFRGRKDKNGRFVALPSSLIGRQYSARVDHILGLRPSQRSTSDAGVAQGGV